MDTRQAAAKQRRGRCKLGKLKFIEPAERESRRAPRGKPARPGFWTHGKTTPRCSILGGPIGIQFCIQILLFFFSLSPWVVAVSLHFCSIFAPFWRPLGSILHHFGAFWRPLGVPGGGPWRRDVFSLIFEAKMVAKWSPRGSQNPFKMGSKFHCFFDPFWRPLGSILHDFGAFWRPLCVPGGGPWRRDVFSLIFEANIVAKWALPYCPDGMRVAPPDL